MRVSVIVPLYNKGRYVSRCLDSIAAQTFVEWETIVVDDGSTDGGDGVVAEYPDGRFRLIRQPNAGPGAARNRGIAAARGELLAFLDADDVWLPDYLETQMRLLDGPASRAVGVTSCYLDYPGGRSQEGYWKARGLRGGLQDVTPATSARRLVTLLAYMSPCSTVARTTAVQRWGGFYAKGGCRYGEDALLWLKVLLNERVYFHLRPLVAFHREASDLSGHLAAARPVEPFLTDPQEVLQCCPDELRGLLRRFLARRACKTAAVLGYWGQPEAAQQLLKRFVSVQDWCCSVYPCALVGCTPIAGWVGGAWRRLCGSRSFMTVPQAAQRDS